MPAQLHFCLLTPLLAWEGRSRCLPRLPSGRRQVPTSRTSGGPPAASLSTTSVSAVSPDGKSVYVVNGANLDAVSQYDIAGDGTLSPKTPAGAGTSDDSWGIALTADGANAYVTNSNGNSVSQFSNCGKRQSRRQDSGHDRRGQFPTRSGGYTPRAAQPADATGAAGARRHRSPRDPDHQGTEEEVQEAQSDVRVLLPTSPAPRSSAQLTARASRPAPRRSRTRSSAAGTRSRSGRPIRRATSIPRPPRGRGRSSASAAERGRGP